MPRIRNSREENALRKNLRYIYGDGVSFSLMVGLGEAYVPAFALAIGMSEVKAGWIVSIPMLAGAVLQLVSPAAVRKLKSHRKWVVLCAFLQAASFFAFMAEALVGHVPEALVFLAAALYWGSGMATGPAWNTWVSTLVPKSIRAGYFARRGRSAQAAVLLGTVAGGLLLQAGTGTPSELWLFAGLFLAAGISRSISTWFLYKQDEPVPLPLNHRAVSAGELLRRARHSSDGRLLLYLLGVQVAVQIAGPFFTPYMLGELKFSYIEYLLLLSTAFAAKAVAFPLAGTMARRFGSQRVLYISGLGIVPLSALWIVSDQVGYLLAVQVLGGCLWAAYELSTFLLLFERIEESERTSVLTLFNLGSAAAMMGGALLGGLLLKYMGQTAEAYFIVFGLSGAARLATIPLLFRLRHVTFTAVPLATRTLAVRPNSGSLGTPIVSSLEGGGEEGSDAGGEGSDSGPPDPS